MPLLLVLLNFADMVLSLSDNWLLLKGYVWCVGMGGDGGGGERERDWKCRYFSRIVQMYDS